MNISSAVIKTLPDSINEVIEIIKAINELKKIPKVISADIVYSYMEDEIGEEIAKLEENELVPPWLNNDSIRAEDIDYKGELKINKKRKQ